MIGSAMTDSTPRRASPLVLHLASSRRAREQSPGRKRLVPARQRRAPGHVKRFRAAEEGFDAFGATLPRQAGDRRHPSAAKMGFDDIAAVGVNPVPISRSAAGIGLLSPCVGNRLPASATASSARSRAATPLQTPCAASDRQADDRPAPPICRSKMSATVTSTGMRWPELPATSLRYRVPCRVSAADRCARRRGAAMKQTRF